VDESLIERRSDTRFPPPAKEATRATLRPGCTVRLINLSAGGALLEARRPLRPGARVHLQVATTRRTTLLAGQVVRCAVWALDGDAGATYRGAVKFEQRCDSVYETDMEVAAPRGPRRSRG
jgi:hypothetical protein